MELRLFNTEIFKIVKKYHYPILFSSLVIASIFNTYSLTTFFFILGIGLFIVLRSISSIKNNEKQEKLDVLTDGVFFLLMLGTAFFIDVYRGNMNAHDLYKVEDEFKILGTMGDFFGGSASLLIGLFTLIFVFNESRENRKRDEARDRREDRKELYDLNQLMLSMFIKRVEFMDNKLSSIKSTSYSGLRALKVFAGGNAKFIEDDVYSYLTQLDDLVEETLSFSSLMALGHGVDSGVKSIRNYKSKVLAGLVSIEHLDVYWRIIRQDAEIIKKTSYICSLLVILKKNEKEIFDLNDDDFINIDLFYKSLIESEKKMNFIILNCDKLS